MIELQWASFTYRGIDQPFIITTIDNKVISHFDFKVKNGETISNLSPLSTTKVDNINVYEFSVLLQTKAGEGIAAGEGIVAGSSPSITPREPKSIHCIIVGTATIYKGRYFVTSIDTLFRNT